MTAESMMARLLLVLTEEEPSVSVVEVAEVERSKCTPWPFKAEEAHVATPKIQTVNSRCLEGNVSKAGF